MTAPDTMWAVAAQGGATLADPGAFRLESRPVPALRERDLLVRVAAVSVNPVDTGIRASLPAGQARVLGWDASGVVEAVGAGVRDFAVGDAVFYAGDISRDGSNAQLQAVDERIVGRKPRSLTHAEAAALPLTTITAWEALFDRFGLDAASSGTLLVVGGAGGVGSILTQLARRLTGVKVISTASRPDSRDYALSMGAHHVVDHRGLVAAVTEVSPDGVDWIFTSHSGGNIEAFAQLLRPFGAITAIDQPARLDLAPLKQKSIAWHWELMFTRPLFETPDMAEQGRLLTRTAELIDHGQVVSTMTREIAGITPEGLREGHAWVDSGRAIGKVVIATG